MGDIISNQAIRPTTSLWLSDFFTREDYIYDIQQSVLDWSVSHVTVEFLRGKDLIKNERDGDGETAAVLAE